MANLLFEHSLWWILPILIGATFFTALLYYKSSHFSKSQRALLSGLRFIVFVILGLLLLSPVLQTTVTKEDKPWLIWLEDHSQSMILSSDSMEVRKHLSNDQLLEQLQSIYRIRAYDFGGDLSDPSDSFSLSSTDIYESLLSASENFYNQNIGAAVLMSDGISNRGGNASYVAENLSFPVFSVGFGDTAVKRDLFIDRIVHNNISYQGNKMPVEIYAQARKLQQNSAKLEVFDAKGKLLYSENFTIDSRNWLKKFSFLISSTEVGFRQFSCKLSPIEGEENLANNSRSFSVEILNNKKKINIVGGRTHPDIGAIVSSLQSLERYEVELSVRPQSAADLYIIHSPDRELLAELVSGSVPVWVIHGPSVSNENLQVLAETQIAGKGFEETYAVLAEDFNLFSFDPEKFLDPSVLPPLFAPFGELKVKAKVYPLMHKKIGAVKTQEPLWYFIEEGQKKSAVLLGTGLWKWRVFDFKMNKSHDAFNDLISKTVQYLTSSTTKKRLIVDIPERIQNSEALRGEARLYNKSLELTNEPDPELKLIDENGTDYSFSFVKTMSTYELKAGQLPEGVYHWSCKVALGDENFEEKGNLLVEENTLEQADLLAQHDVLKNISTGSGGQFYHPTQIDSLISDLLKNEDAHIFTYEEKQSRSLIHEKWLFIMLILFLTAEWGLRKYFGTY